MIREEGGVGVCVLITEDQVIREEGGVGVCVDHRGPGD